MNVLAQTTGHFQVAWVGLLLMLFYLGGLVAAVWLPISLWRRWRGAAAGPLPAGSPPGSRTSAAVETVAIAALGLVTLATTATVRNTNGLMLDLAGQPRGVVVYSVIAFSLAVVGYLAALAIAWRGAGSISVVVMFATLVLYGLALNGWGRLSAMRIAQLSDRRSDVDLVIDVAGTNAPGVDLWANDVYLGKAPVRTTLSEFLEKVPDWPKLPAPDGQEEKAADEPGASTSSTGDGPSDPAWWKDNRWGRLPLPQVNHLKVADSLETAIRRRQGKYIYIRAELDGQPAERTGSSGGSGSNYTFHYSVGFRFPQREAAIERLLDQARLADYKVDDAWFAAIKTYGDDGWIAIRQAGVDEAEMQRVFDALVERRYHLDGPLFRDAAWDKFQQIMREADETGYYLTASPAGRAVEILSQRMMWSQWIEVAAPLIESTSSVSYADYPDLFGRRQLAVYVDGASLPWLPSQGTGRMVSRSRGGLSSPKPFPPSGLAVAHAIWLTTQRWSTGDPLADDANSFQLLLTPALVRAVIDGNGPLGLQLATLLGGPAVDKFLIRKADQTRNVDLTYRPFESEWLSGVSVNRWVYWSAQLHDSAGRRFREQNADALFDMADQITQFLTFHDDVAAKLPFLFLDNQRGPRSIGWRYWPRFRDTVARDKSDDALYLQVAYLVALETASTIDMYVDAWTDDWTARHDSSSTEEALKPLGKLPEAKRAAVLDRLLEHFTAVAQEPRDQQQRMALPEYVLRKLREARYDKIDDAASFAYQLQQLREEPRPGTSKEWQRKRFAEQLAQTAAARPLLVEAVATAPEAEFRLLAIDALRDHPSPRNQRLLAALVDDNDEAVRAAAEAAEAHLDTLRASMPRPMESPAASQ